MPLAAQRNRVFASTERKIGGEAGQGIQESAGAIGAERAAIEDESDVIDTEGEPVEDA